MLRIHVAMSDNQSRITCACCGFKGVVEEYDICDICNWQCDYAQESEPDFRPGPNRSTLREAQQNFKMSGNCDGVLERRRNSALSECERDPDWRPFPPQPAPVEDAKAWRRTLPPRRPNTCSCCGYETVWNEGDVCRICRWQFDCAHESLPHKKFESLNDGLSLFEGQGNYRKFGVFSRKHEQLKEAPRPDDVRSDWWKPADPPTDETE